MILYYSLDGSHWSYCETRPIFNLVDTRCNRIVTAWRPFGTFHQQRFCYSVSVAWDHPLQSASLEIIELSLCHQIYPLDAFLPIFVLFMWTPCLSPKSSSRIASQIRSVCSLKCADRSNCPHLISTLSAPLSAALLGCDIKCPLMRPFSWQGAGFISQFRTQRCTQFWMKKREGFIWIIY